MEKIPRFFFAPLADHRNHEKLRISNTKTERTNKEYPLWTVVGQALAHAPITVCLPETSNEKQLYNQVDYKQDKAALHTLLSCSTESGPRHNIKS